MGAPSEGHGLHGRYSHIRASDVRTERGFEDGDVVLTGRATIDEVEAPSAHLRVERTVRTRTGAGLVEMTDITTDLGVGIEPAPLLCHVNVGVPLDEGARIGIDSEEVLPRDADAERGRDSWMAPRPWEPGVFEMVFEHRIRPIPPVGPGPRSSTPRSASRSTCCGDTPSSPGSTTGSIPVEGSTWWGLEPANCSVLGRAADRAAGVLPVLEPQEARTTELRILVRSLPGKA